MTTDRATSPHADVSRAVAAAAERGWAHLPGALTPAFRRRLQEEITGGPFADSEREVGPVYQEVAGYVLTGSEQGEFPLAEQLRRQLSGHVRAAAVDGADAFVANEVHVQRYAPRSAGITPHRDGTRFRPLLAVFTTAGRARFSVHPARDAEPIAEWEVGPGDLVLLRGPGLGGVADGRPLHAVSGPIDDEARYSVSVRHNAGTPTGTTPG